ncbi:MAG TPA: TIGR03862 family flavoprotein [Kiloniellales bacterium]|jgi:uncharacterized flavoprotein (TIGR03862 family)|nr:TIGR03862 family flavoprotein [Kiloniellales bacterium]
MSDKVLQARRVAIIGAGPAGLMAAEFLAAAGVAVSLHERMPSAGRRLLMAGRGGLNLTHSEPLEPFLERYGAARQNLEPALRAFPPPALRAWAEGLGQETFIGSSGRVFPRAMKASPLLRAWLARLRDLGVELRLRSCWCGWDANGGLLVKSPQGTEEINVDATLLALGGASWPRLGADGAWAAMLAARGVTVRGFRPANCGFSVDWSEGFSQRFAGSPLKNTAFTFAGRKVTGEAIVTAYGLEGSAIYALSRDIRNHIEEGGEARLLLDLRPDLSVAALEQKLARVSGSASTANLLRKGAGLSPVSANLLREGSSWERSPASLALAIKKVPVVLRAPQTLDRAISSAGGIAWPEVDKNFMLRRLPGVFVAGEMLDWEAPTGGYLLQACFATGRAAAAGILAHLDGLRPFSD